MGKINQGVLGGFSGRVGTVVGASWKGIAYMRSLADSVKNPKTDSQVAHRLRFKLLIGFLALWDAVFKTTFKGLASKMSTFNAASKTNWANNPFGGTLLAPTLDYTKICMGRGALPGLASPAVETDGAGIIVTYTNNSSERGASVDDKFIFIAIDKATGRGIYKLPSTSKRSTAAGFTFDAEGFEGHTFAIYGGFLAADGASNSDVIYIGDANPN